MNAIRAVDKMVTVLESVIGEEYYLFLCQRESCDAMIKTLENYEE